MPTISQLSQRHPSCNPNRVSILKSLYEGGELLESKTHEFISRRLREPEHRYHIRIKDVHYRNYLGPIIDYFTAMLFKSRPVAVPKDDEGSIEIDPGEFYNEFREDCDRNGADIDAIFKSVLTDAMVCGRSWLRCHHPVSASPVESLAEYEANDLGRCWVAKLEYDSVLDWETDDSGRLEWVMVHKVEAKRRSIASSRDLITETWEYITADSIDTYQATYEKSKRPSANTEVSLVSSLPHKFARVPVVCLDLPPSLWVASRLASPQLAHFRAINAQSFSLATTCYAMPVAKVKDPEAFQSMIAGAGYLVVLGVEEAWEWEAPPSGHFASLDTEIKAHKDEIYRIANQMALGVENNSASVGRSGESKAADLEGTAVALLAFSRACKEAIERTYDMVTAVRGDKFKWGIEGMDDFASVNAQGLAETMKAIKDGGGVPSKTFNAEVAKRISEALIPDVDQKTKAKIREEIDANTPDPMDEKNREIEMADKEFALKETVATMPKVGPMTNSKSFPKFKK